MKQEREEKLFELALEKAADERAELLDAVCGDDTALRQRVDSLLAAHDQETGFLPGEGTTESSPTLLDESELTEGTDALIGRYKLLEKLGEGGFGSVWAAEQKEPVRRRVALKIIKLGMDTKQVVARFEAERQALALMDHPNIAKVLDAGATDTGRPYFVMELVKGMAITKYCNQEKLETNARLDLFIKVCHAIQHAHQKGIIHRDIKPSNVMVTLHDGVPVPKVIDFGIAKATQQELTEKTIYTQYSQFIGTPAYMSPEQAEMSGLDIDTRSDIYSLGVLLYELLTGTTPFDSKELMQSGLDEMRKIIREREPVRPSTRVSQTNVVDEVTRLTPNERKDRASSRRLLPQIPSDLDWIAMKCLEKDRARRYDTANGLGTDIRRHLNNEPVAAVAPSALYKLRKYAKRNKLIFGTSAAVLGALVLGLSVAVLALVRERAARAEATRLQYASDMKLSMAAVKDGDLESAFALLDRHTPDDGAQDLRGWEWRYLDQFRQQDIATVPYGGSISEVDITPNGRTIVVAYRDPDPAVGSRLMLTDLASQEEIKALSLSKWIWVGGFTFLSGERELIVEGSETLGVLRVDLETESFEPFLAPEVYHQCWPPKVSSDGKWMIGGFSPQAGPDRRNRGRGMPQPRLLRCIDATTQLEVATAEFTSPDDRMLDHELRISPDNRLVAAACADATIRLFSVPDLQPVATFRVGGSPTCIRWSGDSRSLAVACELPNVVQVWDVPTATLRHHLEGVQKSASYDVCLSADASLLATGTYDNLIILWDLQHTPPIERAVFSGHRALPTSVVFSLDGAKLLSADQGGVLKIWDTAAAQVSPLRQVPDEQVGRLAISPDGNLLAVAARDGVVRLFEPSSERLIATLQPEVRSDKVGGEFGKESHPPLAFSADGRFLVAGNGDHTATLYDLLARSPVRQFLGHAEVIHDLALSPDGATLFTVSEDATLTSWSLADGTMLKSTPNPIEEEALYAVACSPGGKLVAVGGKHMGLTLRDAVTHEIVASLQDQGQKSYRPPSINSVRFSPNGRWLACGLQNEMMLFELPSLRKVATFTGLSGPVSSVDFTPDGENLIGVSERGASQMVNLKAMRAVGDIAGSDGRLISARFSPDGKSLAVSSIGSGIRLFRVARKPN